MSVRIRAGTSGFSYKPWRGSFYPEKMKEADMLAFYATVFDTVELNNTFYRLPGEASLAQWAEQVPPGFRFALKASRTITHIKRLKEVAEPVELLYRATSVLGAARGPVLFGLPPNMKLDMDRLDAFLALVPPDVPTAIEFRHESWHDEQVFAAMRNHGVALCIAHDGESETPFVPTATWGYLRLRREEYTMDELREWRNRIMQQDWSEAFVYFKHEDTGTGPRLARELLSLDS